MGNRKEKEKIAGRQVHESGKRLGELAEVLFSLEVLRRGGVVCTPLGDSAPFDAVVVSPTSVSRVQIKSVWLPVLGRHSRHPHRCRVSIGRSLGGKMAYDTSMADALAVWLEPFKSWMIIKVKDIRGRKSLHINSKQTEKSGWEILGLAK